MPERHEGLIPKDRARSLGRRDFLKASGACLALLVSRVGMAAASVVAVRVWPAKDYTRVTLECREAIAFNQFIVKDPERLVVDLEGVELNSILQNIPSKISADDPYIKLMRAGRFKPGTVRLVIDLKTEVSPQVFTLKPVGIYGHRLVVDLYPARPEDPLLGFLQQLPQDETKPESQPRIPDRPIEKPLEKPAEKAAEKTVEKPAEKPVEKAAENQAQAGKGSRQKPVVTRMVTIVIDPGHGGEDPGAIGQAGSMEKEVTLQVAHRLKALIDAEPNMRTLLTREGDYFIPLNQRVSKARKVQADLFVSIHADAFVKATARGSSVFVLSENGASSAAARWLAQTENNADLVGGVNVSTKDANLARTLLDLSQTATLADSLKLGKAVLSELGGVNTLHAGKVEQAGFAVLKAPDIPSILVETAFISNPEEERRLNDDAYQEKIARAILKGIRQYFVKNPPAPKSKLG
ncbi:MAG: N-acetylmuramoyl-L-alanine amidase [Rhodocyclaceae bacterium]|nr:N-acetylmuramoyl-L-alanine amidase [Rhodocyclaceae bacterium]